MTYSAWAPLAGYTDLVLLVVRIILGGTMAHYGWPKVKDPARNVRGTLRGGDGVSRARLERPHRLPRAPG